MARVLRGEIYWADLDPVRGSEQAGTRPVLVIQSDDVNRHSSTTIVLALTSQPQRAGYPLTVDLGQEGGLKKPSWIKTTQIRTLAIERLGRRIGRVSEGRMRQVEAAVLEVLGP